MAWVGILFFLAELTCAQAVFTVFNIKPYGCGQTRLKFSMHKTIITFECIILFTSTYKVHTHNIYSHKRALATLHICLYSIVV